MAARVHRPPVIERPAPNVNPDVPLRRYKGSATLMWKSTLEAPWMTLGGINGPCSESQWNIHTCMDNALSIYQGQTNLQNSDLVVEWRIRYEYNQMVRYRVVPHEAGENHAAGYEVMIEFNSPPCISRDFSSVPAWEHHSPVNFPIRVSTSPDPPFRFVLLRFLAQPSNTEPLFTQQNIEQLLSGAFPRSQLEDIHTWCNENLHALDLETAVARQGMQAFRGCTVAVSRFRPGNDPDQAQEGWGDQMQLIATVPDGMYVDPDNTPEIYTLAGRDGEPFDEYEGHYGGHEIADRAENEGWEAAVVEINARGNQLRLVVLNDTRRIGGRWHNRNDIVVDLLPKFFDPTYQIAKQGFERYWQIVTQIDMGEYRSERSRDRYLPIVAQWNDQVHNRLMTPRELLARNNGQNLCFKLPIPMIMLRSHPVTLRPHPSPITPLVDLFAAKANDSQWNAIQNCLKHELTMVKGAAATGKSLTLSILMHQFMLDRPDRPDKEKTILYTAPTNQATDSALRTTVTQFDVHRLDLHTRICRWHTNHSLEQDYLKNDHHTFDYYHIEMCRLREAGQTGGFRGFITGVNIMRRQGRIQNPVAYRRYKEERKVLTERVLRKMLLVFSSCVSAVSSVGWNWDYDKLFVPKMLIIDEFMSSKPYDITALVSHIPTLERVIVAGDENQLGPLYKDVNVQRRLWALPVATEFSNRRIHTCILGIQYRSHSQLYAPISRHIYGGAIQSFYDSANPRAYMSNFMAQLPLSFPPAAAQAAQNERHYLLKQPIHFLDVPGGVSREAGSTSWSNEPQAQAVNQLVLKLITLDGVNAEDITIVAPYNGHTRLLKRIAVANGWFRRNTGKLGPKGNVISIDTSQGSENEIVIFSVVRSDGRLDFAGLKSRVNVGVSRAKECLYIVGDWTWLKSQQNRAQVLVQMLDHYNNTIPGFVLRPNAQPR